MLSSSQKPFECMAWGGQDAPTEEQLRQILVRDGLMPERISFPVGKSQEMRFDNGVLWVLTEGQAYFGLPGYGSVDLSPGDILEIEAGVFHDISVTSPQEAILLRSFKS